MDKNNWHEETMQHVLDVLKEKGYKLEERVFRSHGKETIPLFYEKKSEAAHFSDADIIVLDNEEVRYVIEVQGDTSPKAILGIISATSLCTHAYIGEERRSLCGAILFIVTPYEIVHKRGSQKPRQFSLIKKLLGETKKFKICTEKEFKEEFGKSLRQN